MEAQLIQVLWLDAALLAIDKPAGLLSLPDGYNPVLQHARALLEPRYGRLWIIHRLDRDTSGVMVLARSADAHHHVNQQFAQHAVEKIYHAMVNGSPDWDSTVVDLPLRSGVGRRKRTMVDHQRGKPALTRLQVLQRAGPYSLVEARPATGRMHQIRAHLTAMGHSIVGDDLYGDVGLQKHLASAQDTVKFSRTLLHAFSLRLLHPITGEPLMLQAPYPADFSAALEATGLRARQAEPGDGE
jgi:RluA family pseudouridine synthase